MNILLVDDEQGILDICDTLIKSEFSDAKTYLASNGQQALGLARNIKFDVILTDYKMPVMDGLELTEQIRNNTINKNTTIMFISGYIPEIEGKNVLWDNVILIVKPFEIDKISKYIKEISHSLKNESK